MEVSKGLQKQSMLMHVYALLYAYVYRYVYDGTSFTAICRRFAGKSNNDHCCVPASFCESLVKRMTNERNKKLTRQSAKLLLRLQ